MRVIMWIVLVILIQFQLKYMYYHQIKEYE